MSTAEPAPYITEDEYLAFDRAAEIRHELVNGQFVAMSGGTRRHSLIAMNVGAHLREQLRGRGCRAYTSDLRVKVAATGAFFYPDVSVACGETNAPGEPDDVLTEPTVIVEVLSPSTEGFDRGAKFAHYRYLQSLQHYVLVAQDRISVEVYTRDGAAWRLEVGERLETVLPLAAVGCELRVSEAYLAAEPEAAPGA